MPNIIFFLLLLLFIKEYNSYEADDIIKEEKSIQIDLGISRKYNLTYLTKTNFYFEKALENSELQINIHSINCKIEVSPEKGEINKINFELYYFIYK